MALKDDTDAQTRFWFSQASDEESECDSHHHDQSRLNLPQPVSHIRFIQPHIVPVQHIRLGRSVVQYPTQHSIPKPQFLPHSCHQLPQVMQHEPRRSQTHRHAADPVAQ